MLTMVVVLGLATFFTVSTIRRLPVVEEWTLMGKKPWACNLCMSLWTSLAWTVASSYATLRADYIVSGMTWAAVAGACLITLEWSETLTEAAGPPPSLGP